MNLNTSFQPNDAAVITWAATTLATLDINVVIGAVTGLTGLLIQFYFKRQQDKREQERHDWQKKNNI